jgi:phosphoserine phosphatase
MKYHSILLSSELPITAGEIPLPEKNNLRIFLIRHGQTEWNRSGRFQGRSDVPLNDEGKEQVRALGLALKDTPCTAIYTSPLLRAKETAQSIGFHHPEIPIIKEEGFVEMELADFDGMEARKWMADHADFAKAWRDNPGCVKMPGPGGECLEDVQARALAALEKISRSHPPAAHCSSAATIL